MFASLAFYAALCAALGIFYATPAAYRVAALLALSVAFYAVAAPGWLGLLAAQVLVAYAAGRALSRATTDRARSLILLAGLLPTAGALVALKTGNALQGLLIPLGVSYYTFKLIAYLVEIFWDEREAEPKLLDFAAYAAFAPQMVCGPIQRPRQFLRQLPRIRAATFDPAQFESGFFAILRGLMLKLLIGDRLALFIGTVDSAPQDYTRLVLLIVVLGYILQLYADFAGYTLMAIGIGRMFGIESPPNFAAPFAARNVQEFWRRWHMTLSSWVADYIFKPLSLSWRGRGRAGLVVSLFTSMAVIGIWHGFTGTFLIFGLLQGMFISVSALTLPARDRVVARRGVPVLLRRIAGAAGVFLLMSFSQIFWQARSVQAALLHLQLLAGQVANGGIGFYDMRTNVTDPVFACMAIALYHGAGAPGFARLRRHTAFIPNWAVGGVALLLLSAFGIEAGSSFVYGQF